MAVIGGRYAELPYPLRNLITNISNVLNNTRGRRRTERKKNS